VAALMLMASNRIKQRFFWAQITNVIDRQREGGVLIMKRRQFLLGAVAGASAISIAKPAVAQSVPEIKRRLTASWPKSLDTLYGSCEVFAKRVGETSEVPELADPLPATHKSAEVG
jgi:hypothetical protein